jgi:hypothetical protein
VPARNVRDTHHTHTQWHINDAQVNCILSAVHAALVSRATGRSVLHLWSDNTYSQLKCFLTFLFLQEVVNADGFSFYEKVNWFLPPVGHTYLEADRGFAQMAHAARKHKTIPSVQAFVDIAKTASPSNPAHCVQLEQEAFKDMTEYLSQFYTKRLSYKTTTGERVLLKTCAGSTLGTAPSATGLWRIPTRSGFGRIMIAPSRGRRSRCPARPTRTPSPWMTPPSS